MPALDTSFIVDLLRGKRGHLKKWLRWKLKDYFYTNEINVLELHRGTYISRKTHQNLEEIKKFLHVWISGELMNQFMKFLLHSLPGCFPIKPIGSFDELIASITFCQDGQIVTKDQHFRRGSGA